MANHEVKREEAVRSLTDLLSEAQAYATLHDVDLAIYQEGAQAGNFSVYLNCNDEHLSEFAWNAFRRMKKSAKKEFASEINKVISGSGDRLMSLETHKKVMDKLNVNAQRARDVAAKKHKEELDNLHVEIEHLASLARDNKREELAQTRRADTWLGGTIFFGLLSIFGFSLWLTAPDPGSRIDTPPALTKIHVSTEAYVDAKGVYRSYGTGEPLDPQPKEWKLP